MKQFRTSLLATSLLASAALATPAFAQQSGTTPTPIENQPADTPAESSIPTTGTGQTGEQEVVVTGSRIARPDLTSSSPVTVVSAAEIASSGNIANVETFLTELPQFYPATDRASNNPGNGLATIDLRAAGVSRTLVLVNGRRFVPSTLGGIVDINNIPTPLVERVDVVTGGASAVYGSDALAGVVNFVLRRNFTGLELNGQYNITEQGDAQIFTGSATVGSNFADNRGNAALFIGYTNRQSLFTTARPYSRTVLAESLPNAAGTAGGCVPGSLNQFGLGTRAPAGAGVSRVPCFVAGGSTLIPSVNFFDIGQTLRPDGTPRPFVNPDDLFNFAPFNYLQLPQTRMQATAIAEYQVTDNIKPFMRATFAWNQVPRELAPTPVSNAFNINLDNPFVTPELARALCRGLIDGDPATTGFQTPTDAQCTTFRNDGRVVNTFFGRRQLENGSRQNPQDTYSFQLLGGVEGRLNSNWNYDVFYQYGRTQVDVQIRGDVSSTRFQQALLVRNVNGTPTCITTAPGATTGTTVATNSPVAGCTPANIFGANTISPAAATFIGLSAQSQTTVREEVAGANLAGNLPITLLANNPVGAAIGVEWRSVGGSFQPDEALRFQVLGFNRTNPTSGNYNVKEAFAELQIPLVQERFIHELRATGAIRFSDYSTVGKVTTYAVGGEFAPVRDIRFRAQYQKAIRAPSIGELFAGQGNNFPSAVDPCSSSAPASSQTQAIRDACIRSGVTNPFSFTQPGGTQVETLIGGNPNLREEESDTYTVGAVVSPRFLPGFNATIDYYKITINDSIATFGGGTANILATCYGPLVGGDPASPFCQAIDRRPNPQGGLGPIRIVSGLNANIAKTILRGVDFGADYRTRLPFSLFGEQPSLALIMRGTRALQSQSQADPLADLVDCVGFYGTRCGDPTPKWYVANTASLKWTGIGFTFQHRYLKGTLDDRQATFKNPARNRPFSLAPTPDRPWSQIDDYHIFDASLNFDIDKRFNLTLGVENLFDRSTPVVGDAADEQNNTYPSRFDPLGRSYYVATKVRF